MESLKINGIKKVAVIGSGVLGSQIAEILSRLGNFKVSMHDRNDELVKKGVSAIEQRLDNFFVSKGKMTNEQKKEILDRIEGTSDISKAVSNADFVIEAVFENMGIKKDVFRELDKNAPPNTILASNTSYQSITEIGSVTERQDKVVGMRFFNPVSRMKLVEVVKGALTSENTPEVTCDLSRILDKEPIICQDSSYGFLANRAYAPMRMEAVQMVWERVAPPESIDKALKLGYNLPIGPLELGDVIGSWGVAATSEEDKIRELGSEKGLLHPLIRIMIRAGYPGGPGKKGIYDFWKDVLSKQ